jgi:hypothetical protein
MKSQGLKNQKIVALAVIAAIAAAVVFLAWQLRGRFEKVEIDQEVGYHGAAQINPLLAAERLYQGLGLRSRTLPGALGTRLPPNNYALLLVSPRRALTAEQMRRLETWVRRGGRLVVAVDEAPSLDPVLAWLGVKVAKAKKDKKDGKDGKDENEEDAARIETVEMPTSGGKARVEAARAPRLVDARHRANFTVGSAAGPFLLRFFEGDGRVIVLSDASFLTNSRIARADHARAAWALVNAKEPVKGVWIVVREDLPTLAGLLARHAGAASASALLLLAAWLWSAGSRFGPVALDPPRDRRSLLEHIEAAGELLLRVGRAEDLVQAAREALLRRVEAREPEWSKLAPAELVERLAHLPNHSHHAGAPGLAPRRVEAALYGPITGPADLAAAVQILETLRRTL